MRINQTGKITEDFYALGIPRVPVYLLDGPEPILFDAGYTALAQLYEHEIKRVIGRRTPAYLFLTHAHFDHVGAAFHFKSAWPKIQITCSAETRDILARPRAIQLIADLNRQASRLLRPSETISIHETPFRPFDVDQVLTHHGTIELGSKHTIKAIHTPGHTWDFMSYWIPEKNILVASEAVGCQDASGYVSTEFLVDYDAYRRSLQRLAQLDVQILCPGHWLVLTGHDAKEHIPLSLEQASAYVTMVKRFLQAEGGNIEAAVTRVKYLEWDTKPWPKQTEPAYVLNTRTRVKKILERMRATEELHV